MIVQFRTIETGSQYPIDERKTAICHRYNSILVALNRVLLSVSIGIDVQLNVVEHPVDGLDILETLVLGDFILYRLDKNLTVGDGRGISYKFAEQARIDTDLLLLAYKIDNLVKRTDAVKTTVISYKVGRRAEFDAVGIAVSSDALQLVPSQVIDHRTLRMTHKDIVDSVVRMHNRYRDIVGISVVDKVLDYRATLVFIQQADTGRADRAFLDTKTVKQLDSLNQSRNPQCRFALDEFELMIFNYLKSGVTDVNLIVEQAQTSISNIMYALSSLEGKGLVTSLPGGTYKINI